MNSEIVWTFLIIILIYLFCYFLPPPSLSALPPESPSSKETFSSSGGTWLPSHLTQSSDNSCYDIPEDLIASPSNVSEEDVKEKVKETKSFYDRVKNRPIPEGIRYLKRKGQLAKKIIPHFPDFPSYPDQWIEPPRHKGTYGSVGERHCITFLHTLFPHHTFTKVRPKWLRNPKTNRPLELDGFCPNLMMAVEYNGIQHYEWPNFFHKTKEEFDALQYRDQKKVEICIEKNICLLVIPYTVPHRYIPLAIYASMLDGVPGIHL